MLSVRNKIEAAIWLKCRIRPNGFLFIMSLDDLDVDNVIDVDVDVGDDVDVGCR